MPIKKVAAGDPITAELFNALIDAVTGGDSGELTYIDETGVHRRPKLRGIEPPSLRRRCCDWATRAYLGTEQTLAAPWTIVNLDSVSHDFAELFDVVTHEYTLPSDGHYLILAGLQIYTVEAMARIDLGVFLDDAMIAYSFHKWHNIFAASLAGAIQLRADALVVRDPPLTPSDPTTYQYPPPSEAITMRITSILPPLGGGGTAYPAPGSPEAIALNASEFFVHIHDTRYLEAHRAPEEPKKITLRARLVCENPDAEATIKETNTFLAVQKLY